MIDTHCHLTDPRLLQILPSVFAEAASVGVGRLVTIGTDLLDSQACLGLCRAHPAVRCVVGVHPGNVSRDPSRMPDRGPLKALAAEPLAVAVGEMGLDYHYPLDAAARDRQFRAFELQLGVAVELEKPVVIHCRDAVDDTLGVLRKYPDVRGVFHCFTGTSDEARRVLDAGFLIGFTGVVTYKPNNDLREVVRLVPADRYVVETDAPYLSPEPVRKQKTCRPAFVMHTAAAVAEVRGVSIEQVDLETTANAETLYGGAW